MKKNFLNLSAQRSGSSSSCVFTLALNTAFRTSGSLATSTNLSLVGRVLSSLCRNSGPTSQLVSISLLEGTSCVARSAGFKSVSAYLHCSGVDMLLISSTRLATYT